MYMLEINKLHVLCNEITILHNFNLSISAGAIHALMGPNGSGKSTLAHAVMGDPQAVITQGTIMFQGQDISALSPDIRARQGIFLSFQHAPAMPGIRVIDFLKEAYRSLKGITHDNGVFDTMIREAFHLVGLDESFLLRTVNDGFSGGEKKRFEMAQCFLLDPLFLILDEPDSGLDIDALRKVTALVQRMRERNPQLSILIITHYRRVLEYIKPDYIHVLFKGALVDFGDYTLLSRLEEKGYDGYKRTS